MNHFERCKWRPASKENSNLVIFYQHLKWHAYIGKLIRQYKININQIVLKQWISTKKVGAYIGINFVRNPVHSRVVVFYPRPRSRVLTTTKCWNDFRAKQSIIIITGSTLIL